MITEWKFRDATAQDAVRIAELVNQSFQVERAFKNGDRTDVRQIEDLLATGRFLLMEKDGDLAVCVYLKPRTNRVYMGMLSVAPHLQGEGLGSRMMREVEAQSREAGYVALDLRFVHLRDDLSVYYTKRGFVKTGTESADGIPSFTVPVHFISMSKSI